MSVFSYKATDRAGKVITGSIEAKNSAAVISRLQESDYFPIKIEEKGNISSYGKKNHFCLLVSVLKVKMF